jgi:threonine aldolase
MNFVSDNAYGAAPEILEALARANSGAETSYGGDAITARLHGRMSDMFEREVAVFPVVTGTAANALALATLVPPHGAIVCHAEAHIAVDECGAPEFFTHGAKLVAIDGPDGKTSAESIERALSRFQTGLVHHAQPAAVSITQATECGTCYRPEEIVAISHLARRRGMKLHMDGARFANAVARLDLTPAEASWRAGVDVLSFGATKNGALAADAVIFFNPENARDFEYRRKKSGHLASKMRFLSAQLLRYIDDDLWLSCARRANALAARLGHALANIDGVEIAYPVESNAVFARVPDATAEQWNAYGVRYLDWAPSDGNRRLIRLVCSFATPDSDVERLIEIARG